MTDDYKVGYRRPPLHTRFQKGKSGNPRGRSKESKNLRTLVKRQLNEKVLVRTGAITRQIPAVEALVVSVFQKALKGDHRAVETILQWIDMEEAKEERTKKHSKMAGEIADLIHNLILKERLDP